MATKGKKYSDAEKRAYYIGVGSAIGFGKAKTIGAMRKKMSPKEKESFDNGFDFGVKKRPWRT